MSDREYFWDVVEQAWFNKEKFVTRADGDKVIDYSRKVKSLTEDGTLDKNKWGSISRKLNENINEALMRWLMDGGINRSKFNQYCERNIKPVAIDFGGHEPELPEQ